MIRRCEGCREKDETELQMFPCFECLGAHVLCLDCQLLLRIPKSYSLTIRECPDGLALANELMGLGE